MEPMSGSSPMRSEGREQERGQRLGNHDAPPLLCCIHSGDDFWRHLQITFDTIVFRFNDHDGNVVISDDVLVFDVLVRGDKYVEGFLGERHECAVFCGTQISSFSNASANCSTLSAPTGLRPALTSSRSRSSAA